MEDRCAQSASCLLLAAALPSRAADDFKVIKLEQAVLELERRVEELSREVARLQQRSADPAPLPAAREDCAAETTCPPPWLVAANWGRVRAGMGEFEVIEILGPPSSVRGAPGSSSRTLMYAMEIGSSAFLSGRVDLKDRHVIEVQVPALR